MTKNHGTPDYSSDAEPLSQTELPIEATGGSARSEQPRFVPLSQRYAEAQSQLSEARSTTKRSIPSATAAIPPSTPTSDLERLTVTAPSGPVATSPGPGRRFALRLPKSWLFWGVTSAVAFSGLGIVSAVTLFRLPSLPNCPAIFWPTASASLRIYCAQLSAERRTVDDLLKAIALVNGLPDNHALRTEIDRSIEEWSQEILELADETFQQGDLKEAIAIAKRIPKDTDAAQVMQQQVQEWQTIWSEAEAIYQESVQFLERQDLRKAFSVATRLLGVNNKHWRTTKYEELNTLITVTRLDSNKLDRARGLADQGGLANLLAAIKLAEEVRPSSPLADRAQQAIGEFGGAMLDLAQALLDQRDYDGAMAVLQQIPDRAALQAEIKDFRLLAGAQAQAWGGSIDDIQAAIGRAQKLEGDRPLYGKAQQLIGYWQLEIQDVQRLDRAQQVAQAGSLADLRTAIAEASLIPSSNPRGRQAQEAITNWRTTIETTEDQPYLDRAAQLANKGDINSLQAAIDEADRIGQGRALSAEAEERIATWNSEIQRIQDQPLLDRARRLAANGSLVDAINVAERITAGRTLYDQAQSEITAWSTQVQQAQDQPLLELARRYASQGNLAQAISVAEQITAERALYSQAQTEIQTWRGQFSEGDRMQQAYSSASAGTPTMLLSAIQTANAIPSEDSARSEANRMIGQWGWQILEIARSQAAYDLPGAIATAQRIPDYAEAYAAAQQQIQEWQQKQGNSNPPRFRLE
jgi:hypothetical protein